MEQNGLETTVLNVCLLCILLQIIQQVYINPSNRNCADCSAEGWCDVFM